MKLRAYDHRGREHWLRPGQIVPAGWYDEFGRTITAESVVRVDQFPGNPYDQDSRAEKFLILQPKNS